MFKKARYFIVLLVLGAAAVMAIVAAKFESKIPANTFVGYVNVGNLTKAEAQQKLQDWWLSAQTAKLEFSLKSKRAPLVLGLAQTGVAPNFGATLTALPMTTVLDSAKTAFVQTSVVQHFPIVFAWSTAPSPRFQPYIDKVYGPVKAARVFLKKDQLVKVADRGGEVLDEAGLLKSVQTGVSTGQTEIQIPVQPRPVRIGSEQLSQIREVVSTFTTKFPTRKKDRNTNIRIASSKINGLVLMPGDTFSFNKVVGKRTIQDGFKEAPVFKNGKHDMGVGGGICQVSSTLYNAALFANLQVVQRHNHSMPVAYLPVGRDATVDYGSLDMVLKNNLPSPIALCADYEPGKLTFTILGKKDPGLDIKIESSDSQSWDAPTKTVKDPKLPAGQKKVVEKGSRGRSIKTFRIVYRDGREVAREPLGRSYYKGGERVVAVGTGVSAIQPPLNSVPLPTQMPGSAVRP